MRLALSLILYFSSPLSEQNAVGLRFQSQTEYKIIDETFGRSHHVHILIHRAYKCNMGRQRLKKETFSFMFSNKKMIRGRIFFSFNNDLKRRSDQIFKINKWRHERSRNSKSMVKKVQVL